MYGGMNPMGDGFDGMQGGGFMEGVSGALGEKSADKKSREKAVLAVTIKQLIDAPADGDGIRVDGTEVSMVRLLGLVEHVEDHSTNKLYRIRDGTGVYDCKMWIEKDPSSHLAESEIRPNTFVRVVGQIKEFAGTRHILLYNITPVVDWNELTHHMLEVILTHCQATKGPIPVNYISAFQNFRRNSALHSYLRSSLAQIRPIFYQGSESAGARFTSRTAPGTPSCTTSSKFRLGLTLTLFI